MNMINAGDVFLNDIEMILKGNNKTLIDLNKALTISGSTSLTDLTQLTDGRAITMENIDRELTRVVADEEDFTLSKLIPTDNINSLVDRYTIESGFGSVGRRENFGKMVGETAFPSVGDLTLAQAVGFARFIRTITQLSHVQDNVDTMVDAHAELNMAGARLIAETREKENIYGNNSTIATSYDGLLTQIQTINDTAALRTQFNLQEDMILDLRGAAFTEEDFVNSTLLSKRNWGQASHLIGAYELLGWYDADLLVDSVRVIRERPGGGGEFGKYAGQPTLGYYAALAKGGKLEFVRNRYIAYGGSRDQMSVCPTAAEGTGALVGTASVSAAMAGTDSLFTAAWSGNYYYRIVGFSADGSTTPFDCAIAAVNGTVHEHVTLSIAHGTISGCTGFHIYRSEKDAASNTDCRWIGDVAKDSGDTTTFVDYNYNIPGTAIAFVLDIGRNKGAKPVSFRQLLPFFKINLPFGYRTIFGSAYAYGLYGYLRLLRGSNILIKNIHIPDVNWEAPTS